MVYIVKKSLDLLKITNVTAESIRKYVSKDLFVINVVLKLPHKRFVEKEWDILN